MAVMREETFGPVAGVAVVSSFHEALLQANQSDYGLAATVLTASMEHAQRAWRKLNVHGEDQRGVRAVPLAVPRNLDAAAGRALVTARNWSMR